jgi:hypothetical protein
MELASHQVLLRNRPARSIIKRPTEESSKLSKEFKVTKVTPATPQVPFDVVVLTPVVSGGKLASFTPGSVIFSPVPAPASVTPRRDYLTLVSPAAERIMKAIGGMMSGKLCDIPKQIRDRRFSVKTPALPPSQLMAEVSQRALPSLIGAFFGGAQAACGVVHPAASCLMGRSVLIDSPHEVFADLCPVCRYILVDQIDPRLHGRIDLEYAKIYPM